MGKKIRVWTLGSKDNSIIPTSKEISQFKELIYDAKKSDAEISEVFWATFPVTCQVFTDDVEEERFEVKNEEN